MKFLKSYTYTWQELAVFKISLMAFGVVVGANWYQFFGANLAIFVFIWIVSAAYILYISFKS